jgi:hypothetical protein
MRPTWCLADPPVCLPLAVCTVDIEWGNAQLQRLIGETVNSFQAPHPAQADDASAGL